MTLCQSPRSQGAFQETGSYKSTTIKLGLSPKFVVRSGLGLGLRLAVLRLHKVRGPFERRSGACGKWMMFWIVFAMYTSIEALAYIFISFGFPFNYQPKIVFVQWLLSPWTKGASISYRKWIHPTLPKHERDVDALLE
ncbi:unnamed protein product [Haemonchus placei]|uniref:Receptor expression-enhancing protein n=1 Tax=Haemonchus placei TaxID=6290 RepID=A0A0N4WZU5_HAEPC|nr:unnamed protein product [Haemonchus placei]